MSAPARPFRALSRRAGFAAVVVLVVFAVVMSLCGAWLKNAMTSARQQRLSEERLQAAWLAEAGVRRGAARWTADAGYAGEEWRLSGEEISRPAGAVVIIRIEPIEDEPNQVQIVARARYPHASPRVRVTKRVNFQHPLADQENSS